MDPTAPRGEIALRALYSFPNAPCLRESLLYGVGGGATIGVLRYATRRSQPRAALHAAFSGAVVLGMTSGLAWLVCRRSIHEQQRPLIQKLRKLRELQDASRD